MYIEIAMTVTDTVLLGVFGKQVSESFECISNFHPQECIYGLKKITLLRRF